MEQANDTIYINANDISTLPPTSLWPSMTLNSNACTIMRNPWEDKLKEYCNATDKHLDDLEEDIEFLDKMRKDMNSEIAFHNDKIGEFEAKITSLQNENVQLHTELDELYNQIYILR